MDEVYERLKTAVAKSISAGSATKCTETHSIERTPQNAETEESEFLEELDVIENDFSVENLTKCTKTYLGEEGPQKLETDKNELLKWLDAVEENSFSAESPIKCTETYIGEESPPKVETDENKVLKWLDAVENDYPIGSHMECTEINSTAVSLQSMESNEVLESSISAHTDIFLVTQDRNLALRILDRVITKDRTGFAEWLKANGRWEWRTFWGSPKGKVQWWDFCSWIAPTRYEEVLANLPRGSSARNKNSNRINLDKNLWLSTDQWITEVLRPIFMQDEPTKSPFEVMLWKGDTTLRDKRLSKNRASPVSAFAEARD